MLARSAELAPMKARRAERLVSTHQNAGVAGRASEEKQILALPLCERKIALHVMEDPKAPERGKDLG
jgi:hypothetical protein